MANAALAARALVLSKRQSLPRIPPPAPCGLPLSGAAGLDEDEAAGGGCARAVRLAGVQIEARLAVEPGRISVGRAPTSRTSQPVLEADAWHVAWNMGTGVTGAAAVPHAWLGRNGEDKVLARIVNPTQPMFQTHAEGRLTPYSASYKMEPKSIGSELTWDLHGLLSVPGGID